MQKKFDSFTLDNVIPQDWRTLLPSPKQIDEEFVRRGFVGVQAEINFINQAYGPGSYSGFLKVQSSPDEFAKYRENDLIAGHKVERARVGSQTDRDETWAEVLNDPELPSFAKSSLLHRLCKDRYEALVGSLIHLLIEARHQEEEYVCKLFLADSVDLRDVSTVTLRKEICNEIMADAYGELGFTSSTQKKGVKIFSKRLSNDILVCAEPDVVTLERNSGLSIRPRLSYLPLVSYDQFFYLGKPKDRIKNLAASLPTEINCIAATRKNRFDDARSFEVMIRANALFDEIKIIAIENAIHRKD